MPCEWCILLGDRDTALCTLYEKEEYIVRSLMVMDLLNVSFC